MLTVSQDLDLSGFLIAHAAFRQEFGLLAQVLGSPLPTRRARLADSQISMAATNLRRHYEGQKVTVRPAILDRAPQASATLHGLDADFAALTWLLDSVTNPAGEPAARSRALVRLHNLTNTYLDREEHEYLPLVRQWITPQEWQADGARAVADMPRLQVGTIFGWFASAASPELRTAALSGVPHVTRLLFNRLAWPAYKRRARRLYEDLAPAATQHIPASEVPDATQQTAAIRLNALPPHQRAVL